MKHKVLIFLAAWRRPAITEICFMGIERLRSRFGVDALCVISEPEMAILCDKYGIDYTFFSNDHLGAKKNAGLRACRDRQFDYLMEIGSDDLVFDELFDLYTPYMDAGVPVFGVKDVIYIDSETGSCRRLQSHVTYGAGRMISRKTLEAVDFTLWGDRVGLGMDNNSLARLKSYGFQYEQVQSPGPVLIDIKSQENIWKFNHYLGLEYPIEKALEKLTERECDAILGLWRQR